MFCSDDIDTHNVHVWYLVHVCLLCRIYYHGLVQVLSLSNAKRVSEEKLVSCPCELCSSPLLSLFSLLPFFFFICYFMSLVSLYRKNYLSQQQCKI